MKAHCERCNREFEFGFGKINLTCQHCSCTDITFDSNFLLYPCALSGEIHDAGKIVYVKGDKFNSSHVNGTIWDARPFPNQPSKKEEEELEEKDIEVEEGGSEEKTSKKPEILKSSKKMREKIGL